MGRRKNYLPNSATQVNLLFKTALWLLGEAIAVCDWVLVCMTDSAARGLLRIAYKHRYTSTVQWRVGFSVNFRSTRAKWLPLSSKKRDRELMRFLRNHILLQGNSISINILEWQRDEPTYPAWGSDFYTLYWDLILWLVGITRCVD